MMTGVFWAGAMLIAAGVLLAAALLGLAVARRAEVAERA